MEDPAEPSLANESNRSPAVSSGSSAVNQRTGYELRLKGVMEQAGIIGEQLVFSASCHAVEDAARAAGCEVTQFVKNICMIGPSGEFIVAIVKGEDRASTKKVAKVLGLTAPPRQATPAEILEKTGYPCGGTPSFGYKAIFIVDPRVLDEAVVYTGGGSDQSLVKIQSQDLVKACNGRLFAVRK